jgi:hypothetical protein
VASSVAKKSITVDRELYEEVVNHAEGNFSRVVNEALRNWVRLREARRLADEVEREFGPVPEELRQRVRDRWPD